jgi:hypothetical protein
MSQQRKKTELSTQVADGDTYKGLSLTARLVLRLLTDKRVNVLLKLLPIGALVYLVMPDPLPIVVDDALVIGLGTYAFIELCPQEIVDEHKANLSGKTAKPSAKNDRVVDIKFRDEK